MISVSHNSSRFGVLLSGVMVVLLQGCLPCGLTLLSAKGQEVPESAENVRKFLTTHCYRCHGENGSAEGGLNYILEYDRLVESGMIDKNNLEKSSVLQRVVDGEMPADDLTKPTEDEIQSLKAWIGAGAPSFMSKVAKREFLTIERVEDHIFAFLESRAPRDSRFSRFFVLTHLYNEGVPQDELQTYRNALTKLVNSLSWGRRVVKLAAVDPEKTIFHVDIRDLNWSAGLWNQIVLNHPYNLEPRGNLEPRQGFGFRIFKKGAGFEVAEILPDSPAEKAGLMVGDLIVSYGDVKSLSSLTLTEFKRMIVSSSDSVSIGFEREGKQKAVQVTPASVIHPRRSIAIADRTRCKIFAIRGDWFVANASRPPLYHAVLDIPENITELEDRLGVNVAQNYFQETYVRAGFNGSGVSRNNRLIEQHDSHFGSYWKSFDFASNSNQQNLFANPFGPGKGEKFFVHDGGEMIFTLPNGFQGYMLTDAAGQRLDKGPTAIVSDPQRPDRAVENGISCMSCHAQGLIRKQDQILNHINANSQSFTTAEVFQIRSIHRQDRLDQIFDRDLERFAQANAEAGIPLSKYEPILMLVKKYEQELTAKAIAAELQIEESSLANLLANDKELSRTVGQVLVPGATVQRETVETAFQSLMALTDVKAYDRSPFSDLSKRNESTVSGIFDNALLFSTAALDGAPTLAELSARGYDLQVITLSEPQTDELGDSVQADFANRIVSLRKMSARINNPKTEFTLIIIDEPIRNHVFLFSSNPPVVNESRRDIFGQVQPLLTNREFDKALNLVLVEIGKLPKIEKKAATAQPTTSK